jgi:LmbE family N-acetylglucosaminyl deacetylase
MSSVPTRTRRVAALRRVEREVMGKTALAIGAHPDDIELMMAGTLLLVGRAGYRLHYMNVANGSCGTMTLSRDEIVAIRTQEASRAAAGLGATFHGPLVDDIQIYYAPALAAALCSVVRKADPEVLLVPSPQDYMEDHVNASRLAVTAAFCRNMRNFEADPPAAPVAGSLAVYHALPWGLKDPLRKTVSADIYVDISDVIEKKREALACHRSQKEWLDSSQGFDSYLRAMEDTAAAVGRMSGRFRFAEGWCRHNHLGFGPEDFDPLSEALGDLAVRG